MNKTEILKGNTLIAEFMGAVQDSSNCGNEDDFLVRGERGFIYIKDLKYHSSWNWLMSVIEKIELTNYVRITGNFCGINKTNHNEFNEWAAYVGGKTFFPNMSKIEATWLAVVEFIKYYNENKRN